ncbi:diacylglycerol kinase [Sphingomonas floccifaciens]|uniref:Diacylglycerol kinase n=1 Tax=Sphingomonas floccifaciens TaxID=1844115 RepID=A0ABW4N9Z4_9SPHN
MKGRPFHERLSFALAGLKAAWVREVSFRTQTMFVGAVGIGLLILKPAPIWWAVVALVCAIVLALELLNSAIEGVIDLLHPGLHPEIKVVKDMVAGAVLAISLAAVAIAVAMVVETGPSAWSRWVS